MKPGQWCKFNTSIGCAMQSGWGGLSWGPVIYHCPTRLVYLHTFHVELNCLLKPLATSYSYTALGTLYLKLTLQRWALSSPCVCHSLWPMHNPTSMLFSLQMILKVPYSLGNSCCPWGGGNSLECDWGWNMVTAQGPMSPLLLGEVCQKWCINFWGFL